MTKTLTYETLIKAATARNVSCDEVDQMIDAARVNADDTVFIEKSASADEWERVFSDSLEQSCAYAEPHQAGAVAWFVKQGVRF